MNRPPAFHIMTKPRGAICNLDCEYCFFLKKEDLYPESNFFMSDDVLESFTRQYIEAQRVPEVTFTWQGGEPTLMGLDFFERAIYSQNKYRTPGIQIHNAIQTNGTLLDDEWGKFFKQHNFLVGLSLDGPSEFHNAYRKDKGSKPTFDRVMNVRAGRVEDLEAVPAERAEEIPGEAEGDNLAAMATRLMRVPMLAGLEHSQLKLLAFTSDTLTYDVGERIIQQGDTGDCAYVITGGEAKIVVERDGQERFIRTCGENEILGELALLNDIPRTASIEAVTELTVLRMSKDVFLELLKANNHAAHAVMREIAQRLASMT